MLKLLKNRQREKIIRAVEQGDLDVIAKYLKGKPADELNQPIDEEHSLSEIAIHAGQEKALNLLLGAGANPNARTRDNVPLLFCALLSNHSLGLVSELLKAGADVLALHPHTQENIVIYCIKHCPPERLMLHLNRLHQYGASLSAADPSGKTVLDYALATQDRNLLQFLVMSGAPTPQEWSTDLDADLRDFLVRCVSDLHIRQMFLNQ